MLQSTTIILTQLSGDTLPGAAPEELSESVSPQFNFWSKKTKLFAASLDLTHFHKEHRVRLWQILKIFDSMWGGPLAEISVIAHHISLRPDAHHVVQRPYRTGPKARGFVAKEIERKYNALIIVQATA